MLIYKKLFALLLVGLVVVACREAAAAKPDRAGEVLQSLVKAQARCEWDKALVLLDELEAKGGTPETLQKIAAERQAIQARIAFETTTEGKRWREFSLKLVAAHDSDKDGNHIATIDTAYAASQMFPTEWEPYSLLMRGFVKLGRWDEAMGVLDTAGVLMEDERLIAQIGELKTLLQIEKQFAQSMSEALRCVTQKDYKAAAAAFESAWKISDSKRLPAASGAVACHLVLNQTEPAKTLVAAVTGAGKSVEGADSDWAEWAKLKTAVLAPASSGTASKGKSSGGSKATPSRKKSMAEQFLNSL